MKDLALVTGGGGGIGAAVCRSLSADYRVLVAGRDQARLKEAAASIGDDAEPLVLDVTDADAAAAVAQDHDVRCLVANAGVVLSGPIGAPDAEASLRHHLEINFLGAVRLVEHLAPRWKAAGGGRVVFIASSAALAGYAYVSAYAASKHALLGYARCAALELARHHIGVNVVCPYYVDSPMTDASAARIAETTGRSIEEARAIFASQNPGGRLVTPEEVAEATLALVRTPRTGVVLELPGGAPIEREVGQPLE
jgi:3-hydroxybutyrate dehydrogenase